MDTKSPCGTVLDASPSHLAKTGEDPGDSHQQQLTCKSQPQQKKQLRRRHSTSRPYQERLLNMAEARREIVAALKFHRAAMKRAGEKQQQRQQQQEHFQQEAPPPLDEQQKEMRTTKNPATPYPFNTTPNKISNNFRNSLTSVSYPQFSWDDDTVLPLPFPENLKLILPNKPLGLNLNFDYFANMHATLNTDGSNPPSHHPSSSCSHSNASLVNNTTTASQEVRPDGPSSALEVTSETGSTALYTATISEEHKMVWNDELNSAISGWWCKFIETKEMSPDQIPLEGGNGGGGMEGDDLHSFDAVLDIPAWLGGQEHLDEYYSEDYLRDITLPCMDVGEIDIGEIEAVDCEWLS